MMALMLATYVINAIDRGVVSVVIEPLKEEFGLLDSEIGLITGLAFGVSYSLAVLPIGWLVDRFSRRNLLALLLALWSGMTALSGFATSFAQLFLLRIGVGATESGASPAMSSLISDLYEPAKRINAFSLMFVAVAVGGAVAAAGGGWIAEHHGWRAAFLVAGVPGLIVAVLLYTTTREPARGGLDERKRQSVAALPLAATLRFCIRQPSLLFVYGGAASGGAALSILAVWTIPFLMRSHGLSLVEAGAVVAVAFGSAVAVGAVTAALVVTRVSRWRPAAGVILVGLTTLAAAPLAAVGLLTDDVAVAIAALFVAKVFISSYLPIGTGVIVQVTDARMRGFAISVRDFLNNLVGYGVAPFVVGVISTAVGGTESLRQALLITLVATMVGTGLNFLAVARTLARDGERAEAYGADEPLQAAPAVA